VGSSISSSVSVASRPPCGLRPAITCPVKPPWQPWLDGVDDGVEDGCDDGFDDTDDDLLEDDPDEPDDSELDGCDPAELDGAEDGSLGCEDELLGLDDPELDELVFPFPCPHRPMLTISKCPESAQRFAQPHRPRPLLSGPLPELLLDPLAELLIDCLPQHCSKSRATPKESTTLILPRFCMRPQVMWAPSPALLAEELDASDASDVATDARRRCVNPPPH
jgi:hypothetical protein